MWQGLGDGYDLSFRFIPVAALSLTFKVENTELQGVNLVACVLQPVFVLSGQV